MKAFIVLMLLVSSFSFAAVKKDQTNEISLLIELAGNYHELLNFDPAQLSDLKAKLGSKEKLSRLEIQTQDGRYLTLVEFSEDQRARIPETVPGNFWAAARKAVKEQYGSQALATETRLKPSSLRLTN